MTIPSQKSPFLRMEHGFPDEIEQLSAQLERVYGDIAHSVNFRTIGNFADKEILGTGENWFFTSLGESKQGVRKSFEFTTFAQIPHGIDFSTVAFFTRIFCTIYDGTSWHSLPNAYVNVRVGPTNINFEGTLPSLIKGQVCVEFLPQ